MNTYLGWDCAYKSLAWSFFSINTDAFRAVIQCEREILRVTGLTPRDFASPSTIQTVIITNGPVLHRVLAMLAELNAELAKFMDFHDIGARDLLGKQKISETTEIQRTRILYDFLQNSRVRADAIQGARTIIEHQPPKVGFGPAARTNNVSTVVAHQLAFYYINNDPVFIDPKLKNNIALRDDLTYGRFLEEAKKKYKSAKDIKYYSRKNHTKANFLYLVELFGLEHILANIPKSMLDDAADATMQVFAYIANNGSIYVRGE